MHGAPRCGGLSSQMDMWRSSLRMRSRAETGEYSQCWPGRASGCTLTTCRTLVPSSRQGERRARTTLASGVSLARRIFASGVWQVVSSAAVSKMSLRDRVSARTSAPCGSLEDSNGTPISLLGDALIRLIVRADAAHSGDVSTTPVCRTPSLMTAFA